MTRQRQDQALKAEELSMPCDGCEDAGRTNRSPEHSSRIDFRTTTSFHHHTDPWSMIEKAATFPLEPLECVMCVIELLMASRYFDSAILNGAESDGCTHG